MNESVITDYSAAPFGAEVTDHGWTFEEGIPWEILAADMKDKCGADVGKVGKGTEVTALLIYNDYNNHKMTNWFGTTKTGYTTEFSWEPDEHGIFFTLLGEGEKAPESASTTEPTGTTSDIPVTSEKPQESTSDITADPPTGTSSATEAPSATAPSDNNASGGGNAWIYIIIAAVIVCGAAAAIIIVRKKKK